MKKFILTDDHVKLLANLNFTWDVSFSVGVPAVDAKRPLGSKDVVDDIVRILDMPTFEAHGEITIDDTVREKALKIFQELDVALAVMARSHLESGVYEAGDYADNWQWVAPVPKPPVCDVVLELGDQFTCNLPKDHLPVAHGGLSGHDGYWRPVKGGNVYFTSDAAKERGFVDP